MLARPPTRQGTLTEVPPGDALHGDVDAMSRARVVPRAPSSSVQGMPEYLRVKGPTPAQGGMSKGERNRIKIRVRSAMAAQAKVEGRYLGGRPPYGYRLTNLGPHPNPAKAADGRQLHGLAIDETAAPVVVRIFAEFLRGSGLFAIAEGLTRDGTPCPSAHDPARNSHRDGLAWSKGAIRAILTNPRYTGRQVWNRQRKDEVLLDVEDVISGTPPGCAGTPPRTGSGRTRLSTRRSSRPRCSPRPSRFSPAGDAAPATRRCRARAGPTHSEARSTAPSATGRCKGTLSATSPTTAAATPRSTPWRTQSATQRTSTCARTLSCLPSTAGSPARSHPRSSPAPSMPWSRPSPVRHATTPPSHRRDGRSRRATPS